MRYIIYISIFFLSLFCFSRANAQVSTFGTNNPNGWSKTVGGLWLVKYAGVDSSDNYLAIDAEGKVYRKAGGGTAIIDSTYWASLQAVADTSAVLRGLINSKPDSITINDDSLKYWVGGVSVFVGSVSGGAFDTTTIYNTIADTAQAIRDDFPAPFDSTYIYLALDDTAAAIRGDMPAPFDSTHIYAALDDTAAAIRADIPDAFDSTHIYAALDDTAAAIRGDFPVIDLSGIRDTTTAIYDSLADHWAAIATKASQAALDDSAQDIRAYAASLDLQDVTTVDSVTSHTISMNGGIATGYAFPPGGSDGGSGWVITRQNYYDPLDLFNLGADSTFLTGSARGFRDRSRLTLRNNAAYVSFDARPVFIADTPVAIDHVVTFQALPRIESLKGGHTNNFYAYFSGLTNMGSTLDNAYHFKVEGAYLENTDNHYVIWSPDMSASGALRNWGVYIGGTGSNTMRNYFGDRTTFGDTTNGTEIAAFNGDIVVTDSTKLQGEVIVSGLPSAATKDSILATENNRTFKIPIPSGGSGGDLLYSDTLRTGFVSTYFYVDSLFGTAVSGLQWTDTVTDLATKYDVDTLYEAIPDVSGFIPYSDTAVILGTKYDDDTARATIDGEIAGKQDALGYTAENVANKATNFSVLNNTLYPTTLAVVTQNNLIADSLRAEIDSHAVSIWEEVNLKLDITTAASTYVPLTRTINGAALSANITLDIDDVAPTQTGNSGKVLTTDGTNATWQTPGGGSGTVTSFSFTDGGGFDGTVTNSTTTPTLAIALQANTNFVTDAEKTVIGNTSGTNTGDQTTITGNAGTATALQTARNIDGVSFDGTAAIVLPRFWQGKIAGELDTLTTGVKLKVRFPYTATITGVKGEVNTASSSGNVTIDILKNGSTIMTTNKIVIEATETTSRDATTQPTLTTTAISEDDVLEFEVTGAGTNAISGAVTIYYTL